MPLASLLAQVCLQAVDSWIEKLDATEFRPLLTTLFARYVDATLEHCRRNFKYVVPVPTISQVMAICKILESILPQVSMYVPLSGAAAPN